jgi:hypothetical protein
LDWGGAGKVVEVEILGRQPLDAGLRYQVVACYEGEVRKACCGERIPQRPWK